MIYSSELGPMKLSELSKRLKAEEAPENPVRSGAQGARRKSVESLRQKDGADDNFIYYLYCIFIFRAAFYVKGR